MALVRHAMAAVPHLRRDHGDPFLPIQTPQVPSTSTLVVAPSEAATIARSSSLLKTVIQSTSTTSIIASTSTSRPITSLITATSSSSVAAVSITASSNMVMSSSVITKTATATATAAAPPIGSTLTSTPSSTLIILSVLSFILGILGLGVLILVLLRRHARRQRDRSIKREIELVGVPPEGKLADIMAAGEQARNEESGRREKWEVWESRTGDDDGGEDDGELPAYSR